MGGKNLINRLYKNISTIFRIIPAGLALLSPSDIRAGIISAELTLPENNVLACEHPWTIRMLEYYPSPVVPRRMYFAAANAGSNSPEMYISLTMGPDSNTSALVLRTSFDKAQGILNANGGYRIFTDFIEGHGIAASAGGSTIGMLARRPNGTSTPGSFDKDLLLGHNWETWMTPTLQQPACTTEAVAIDEMWMMEWNTGDIQAAPSNYIVHKSIGSWEYGNNYLMMGESDNTYGIAVKAMVYDGGCGPHEADAFLIMDRSDYSLTTRGWSWACGTGHTMFNRPAFQPGLNEYGMLCATDYNEGAAPNTGAVFMHVEGQSQNEFFLVNNNGLRIKGGNTTLQPTYDGTGYIGVIVGVNGTLVTQEGSEYPVSPPTSIGLVKFDALGNLVGTINWIVTSSDVYYSYPQLTPLGDGKYLLGYGEMFEISSGDDWSNDKFRVPTEYYLQEIDSAGNFLTAPLALDTLGWGEQDQMVSLGDGYVGWAYIPDPKLRVKGTMAPCASTTLKLVVYQGGTPQIIVSHPTDQSVTSGQTAGFSITANGTSVTYQWQKDGTDISGATSADYITPATVLGDDGAQYRCIATEGAESDTSNSATLTVTPAGTGSGTITREWWTGISGTSVTSLTGDVNYPDNPSGSDEPTSFEAPTDWADSYGTRMHGYVHPPVTGDYVFYLASDDNGELWLSTSEDTAAIVQIASVPVWSGSREWDKYAEQQSTQITLTAGQKYYIRALQKEGSGGDNLAVAWWGPNNPQGVIDGIYLSPYLGEPVLPPSIDTHPADQTVTETETASFTVTASGDSPVYQWQKDGVDIAGANSAGYTTPATSAADDNSSYRCVVTNSAGADTSNAATLTVNLSLPVISSHPAGASATEGETSTFNVTATGTAISYQWQKDDVDIAGATGTSYTTPILTRADSNTAYRVIVTNSAGSDTSNSAVLLVSILVIPPQITSGPSDTSVIAGESAGFNVIATGTDLVYQWNKNGSPIAGATGSTYNIPTTVLADSGQYTCDVSNDSGSITSSAATLTVSLLPPVITAHPLSLTVTEGDSVVFTLTATGTGIVYQWQSNGILIPGASESSYTIAAAELSDDSASFVVIVSNDGGSVTSNPAVLTVIPAVPVAPVIISPANESFHTGLDHDFVWNAVTHADSYELQISLDTLFTNILIDLNDLTLTQTAVMLPTLNTRYYWRVRAVNISGAGPYSNTWVINITSGTSIFSIGRGLPGSLGVQTRTTGPTAFVVSVPKNSRVRLELFNPKNGAVTTIVNQYLNAGYYRMEHPEKFYQKGIFVYRIMAGKEVKTGKLFVNGNH